ncbi:MAG: ABC transporter, permease protein (cluster 9, phospholipid), partial [uncultured Sphingomonas sp.]
GGDPGFPRPARRQYLQPGRRPHHRPGRIGRARAGEHPGPADHRPEPGRAHGHGRRLAGPPLGARPRRARHRRLARAAGAAPAGGASGPPRSGPPRRRARRGGGARRLDDRVRPDAGRPARLLRRDPDRLSQPRPPSQALPLQRGGSAVRRGRRARARHHRADELPHRHRHWPAGRGAAAAVRCGGLHHQPHRPDHRARARALDDRHHGCGPLGFRLRRPDRHHEDHRGGGRDAHHRRVAGGSTGHPAADRVGGHDAAARLLGDAAVAGRGRAILLDQPRDPAADLCPAPRRGGARDRPVGRPHQGARVRLHHRAGRLLPGHAGGQRRRAGRAQDHGRRGAVDLPGDHPRRGVRHLLQFDRVDL